MIFNALCERGCKQRLSILKMLAEGPKTTKQLSLGLKGRPSGYAQIYSYLRLLQDCRLIYKKGKLWYIEDDVKKILPSILDPKTLKLYLAGTSTALKVLQSLPFQFPYLLSAGHYWNGKFRLPRELKFASEIFVDSGAQQFYRYFNGLDYPYSAIEYVDFAVNLGANLIATLDLPLDILTPRGLDVKAGLKKTVDYGVNIYEYAEKLGISNKVVPVLQGFDDASQWLECLDLYKDHGIQSDIWGIGSLCMTKSIKLVSSVIQQLRNELEEKKLHVFGLALNALKKVFKFIDSFDTSAWVYWAKMDGAVFVWDPLRKRFIQLQARDGKRYDTLSLMRINIQAIFSMVEDLNICKNA